jgi:hypothetical protein
VQREKEERVFIALIGEINFNQRQITATFFGQIAHLFASSF